jgi:hypothetical protein
VALCLDISGSMNALYRSGKIQALVERVLALGLRFDDNEAVDVFLFGANVHEVGELRMNNFQSFLGSVLQRTPRGRDVLRQGHAGDPGNYWGMPGRATSRSATTSRCTSCSSPTGRPSTSR